MWRVIAVLAAALVWPAQAAASLESDYVASHVPLTGSCGNVWANATIHRGYGFEGSRGGPTPQTWYVHNLCRRETAPEDSRHGRVRLLGPARRQARAGVGRRGGRSWSAARAGSSLDIRQGQVRSSGEPAPRRAHFRAVRRRVLSNRHDVDDRERGSWLEFLGSPCLSVVSAASCLPRCREAASAMTSLAVGGEATSLRR